MEGKKLAQLFTIVTLFFAVILSLVYFSMAQKVSDLTTNLTTTIIDELELLGLSDNSIIIDNPELGIEGLELIIDGLPVKANYEIANDLVVINLEDIELDPENEHSFEIITSSGNLSGRLTREQSRQLKNSSNIQCGDSICNQRESCAIDCSIELFCNDGIDNDLDGEIDGDDSDCEVCGDGVCSSSEDCSSCETDCLSPGKICCDYFPYTGDCCNNFDCSVGYECINNNCTELEAYCGDGDCDSGESCADDCQSETYCNDGVDNDADDYTDLNDSDCMVCGNNVCDESETCSTCPNDCINLTTHVCCYGVAVIGDCCSDVYCDQGYACNKNKCELKCGNGVCQSGENCGNCPSDCLDSGELCCNNAVKIGDCCTTSDCNQNQACVSNTCTDLIFCGAEALSQSQLCCDNTIITGDCCNNNDCDYDEYCLKNQCTPLCGNGICDNSESCTSCPNDCECTAETQCGDGVCDSTEDCDSCPSDCGICNSFTSERAYSLQALCWSLGVQVEVQSNQDDAFSLTLLDECLEAIGCGNQLCSEGKYCVEGSCEDCANDCDGECESPFCINDPDCAFIECCGNGVCGLAEECAIDCTEVCGDQIDNDENGLIDDGCEQTLTQFSDGSATKSLIYEEPGEQEVSITLPIGAIVSSAKFTVEGKQHWSKKYELGEGYNSDLTLDKKGNPYITWASQESLNYKVFSNGLLSDTTSFDFLIDETYDLELDSNDVIHILYSQYNSNWYTNNQNNEWLQPYQIEENPSIKSFLNIAIDELDRVHIVYMRPAHTTDELMYGVKDEEWTFYNLDISQYDQSVFSPRIAIDSNNKPHIVYNKKLESDNDLSVYYINKIDQDWSIPQRLSNGEFSSESDITIDSNDNVYAIWRSNGDLGHITKTNNEWSEASLIDETIGFAPRIEVNPSNTQRIVTYERDDNRIWNIYLRESSDSFANRIAISNEETNQKNPEIKIDDYDNIYLLWEDVDVYNLLFRYKSYPKDITIGIGSPYGLDVPGYFSSVYPVETGLDLQLNSIVSDCQCPFCIINGDDCTFTMKLGSSSAGQIDIQDLKIVYTE